MSKRRIISSENIKVRTQLAYTHGVYHLFDKHESNEEIAVKSCKKYIKFMNEYGRKPRIQSSNNEETTLAMWGYRATSLNYVVKYPVLNDIAINSGYPDMFIRLSNHQYHINKCNELITFITTNGTPPLRTSKNINEKRLNAWTRAIKRTWNSKSNSNIPYEELLHMISPYNIEHLFQKNTPLDTVKKIVEFTLKYKKFPYAKSTDPYEVSLAESRNNFRRKIKKNPESYKSLIQYANDNGCINLFEYVDKDAKNLNICNQIIEYLCLYNKYPTKRTNLTLSRWLDRARVTVSKGRIYITLTENLIKLVSDAGYPNMFNANWRDDLRK